MTTAPHLDDETISAALDGELAGDEAGRTRAHLDDCTVCRARFEVFEDVAASVRTPHDEATRPGTEARDAAIARALGEADGRGDRRDRNRVPLYAVAAVLALLLLAVPLVASLSSSGGTDDDVAAGSGSDTATLESSGGADADEALVDLGVLDAGNLATVVGQRLGAPAAMAAPSAGGAGPAATGAEAADPFARDTLDGGDAASGAGGLEDAAPTAARARACEDDLDATGTRTLVARATWDGEPAAVLVYRQGNDVTAYVVDPAGCAILHFVRFPATP